MTKARRNTTSTTPIKSEPVGIEDQIAEFFRRGGKVRQIPLGVCAETPKDRRELVLQSARNALPARKSCSKNSQTSDGEDDD